ncbi:Os09g0455150 [Oryza sativa Japonica Group]|uniref:Uncharacterized protein n=2 Tax=Oryza sativa subsp. japonica TaxID=39947 RepID=A0A8J8XAG5_ORYSJ|nr:hypothetical protein OsJ_29615 [Oryza sativa Japonica Group]BAT08421.1 Os09g0455150 [Oryza sativa Japonica Group]
MASRHLHAAQPPRAPPVVALHTAGLLSYYPRRPPPHFSLGAAPPPRPPHLREEAELQRGGGEEGEKLAAARSPGRCHNTGDRLRARRRPSRRGRPSPWARTASSLHAADHNPGDHLPGRRRPSRRAIGIPVAPSTSVPHAAGLLRLDPPAGTPDPAKRGPDQSPPTSELADDDHHLESSLRLGSAPSHCARERRQGALPPPSLRQPSFAGWPLGPRRGGGEEEKWLAAALAWSPPVPPWG